MRRALIIASCVVVTGCAALPQAKPPAPQPKPEIGAWGLDLGAMDKSVNPGDDFFDYVNGTWLKTATIPADRSAAGVWLDLQIQNENRLKGILTGLETADDASLDPEQKKLRDFFAAFTDTAAIEANGMKPAQADLDFIEHLSSRDAVAKAMFDPRLGLDGPFSPDIDVDDKNPDAYAVRLYQSGLGLPDRDYYLRKDDNFVETRKAYQSYLATMMKLAGLNNAEQRAKRVYALELQIAKAQWPAAERRDANKTYNPMTITELGRLAMQFPWRDALTAARVPLTGPQGERKVIVSEKSAFPKLSLIFADTPVSVWRDYLVVRYMHSFAAFLPKAVDDADFDFYGKVLAGRPEQLDRVTRGEHLINAAMGQALGKLYVAKYFPPEAKAKAEALVQNLLKAYDADIRTLDWMTDATKQKALDKLHNINVKIGYPDKWRDYSALQISPSDLVGDEKNASEFEWMRQVKRIDEPVDKTEWHMSPPTINAYYSRSLNEIVFPAGILAPPFFDPNADDAVNYGAIGSVIGHEISHGFDDQGAKYDATGALNNWWQPSDLKAFQARTAALADQFDGYEALPGIDVNGKLTLGENIADLAGEVIAYKAYQISLGGKPAPVLDGFTGDQRFYLAHAQVWREKIRDATLREYLLSDPHSPDKYRVNGIVRNDDGWYTAFDVKPSDKLYLAPDARVHLW